MHPYLTRKLFLRSKKGILIWVSKVLLKTIGPGGSYTISSKAYTDELAKSL